ncbi:MAG: hypothetical protein ACJAYJ_005222 [Saprospiraceae bacterium]|jgi:hypothetical protein
MVYGARHMGDSKNNSEFWKQLFIKKEVFEMEA